MGLHRTTIRPTSDKALKRSLSRGTESSNPAANLDALIVAKSYRGQRSLATPPVRCYRWDSG